MGNQPLVTVSCICYNHAKYLRRALDSIICQKTNFPFEIIIHDDASTDGSQDILREYKDRYPERITLIQQTENQYNSQEKGTYLKRFILPLARGKYLAQLETDDFWCDENKLQKQVDAMEKHPECLMSFHRIFCCGEDSEPNGELRPAKDFPDMILRGKDAIDYILDHLAPTGSRMFLMSAVREKESDPPEFMKLSRYVADLPDYLYYAAKGGVLYLSDVMGAYREMSQSSFTRRISIDPAFRCKALNGVENMWLAFAKVYPEYQPQTELVMNHYISEEALTHALIGTKAEYRKAQLLARRARPSWIKNYSKMKIVKIWVIRYAPWAYAAFRSAKGLLRKCVVGKAMQ